MLAINDIKSNASLALNRKFGVNSSRRLGGSRDLPEAGVVDTKARGFSSCARRRLARLRANQCRRDEAHTMLAEIYGWFTEALTPPT